MFGRKVQHNKSLNDIAYGDTKLMVLLYFRMTSQANTIVMVIQKTFRFEKSETVQQLPQSRQHGEDRPVRKVSGREC